ncbi:MAG: prolyl oligopeptidase family serine peptidase [Bacteroidales bacterium]
MRKLLFFITMFLIMNSTISQELNYPKTKKVDVVENYHGTLVSDPYRWLEDDNSPETKLWIKEQNELTFSYLSQIPFRDKLRKYYEEIWNYERMGTPSEIGDKLYYFKNSGLQNQSVFCEKNKKTNEELVLLDPNKWDPKGTTAISALAFSHDKQYLAYGISKAGSDWVEIFVMDLKTKKLLPDHIKWAKFTSIAWYKDGFFYSGYEITDSTKALTAKNEYHKIYYHKIGTQQNKDKLIYENNDYPLRNFLLYTDKDEKYAFLYENESTSGIQLHVSKLPLKNNSFSLLFKGFEHDYYLVDIINDFAYFITNEGAPNYKLIKISLKKPSLSPKTVIAESKFVLNGVFASKDYWVIQYQEDVKSKLYLADKTGKILDEIKLPTIGTVAGISTYHEHNNIYFTFTSYLYPPTIFYYNADTRQLSLYFKPSLKFNPDDYVTEQIFYTSKDGTKIPMFITHKKDIKLDGNNPTLMYGYGGFNISVLPSFSIKIIPFLERGGIYAVPNIRGGGEYGKIWHEAGIKEKKQNVFDDFIAAAEYLISRGYTSPSKLAINGGSNGGLLVGAVMTQRPDLFKVALPAVGVMDMLRYHKFTIGWAWISDYGSSDDPNDFEYLYAYSPLHNIKEGVEYPATLVTTADHDDRVVPAHSFKFIATLQEKQTGNNPVLIRIETDAGHGGGKPIAKTIDEVADVFAFMMFNLGMEF